MAPGNHSESTRLLADQEFRPNFADQAHFLDDESVDKVQRQGFAKKVFAILTAQLTATAGIAVPFILYAEQNKSSGIVSVPAYVPILAFVGLIGCMCVMCCAQHLLRQFPTNYAILSVFTICEGLLVGMVTMAYTWQSVMLVVGITAAVTFGLMLFAMQTKYDFTGMGPYLLVALIVFMIMGFVLMFFPGGIAHQLYAGMGACLFSFYIVYDVQMIVGGKNSQCRYQLDDYCLAALNVYVDIIQLFLYMLQLFGDRR